MNSGAQEGEELPVPLLVLPDHLNSSLNYKWNRKFLPFLST
jgi:hypothetical protein